MLCNRQNHNLYGRYLGRQNQAVVVAVGHDDTADQTGGNAPGGFVGIGALVVLVGEFNAECLGKAVAEIVGGAGLQCLTVMHHALDGIGRFRAIELLLVGLLTPGDRHCQHILAEVRIDIEHGLGECLGLLGSGMDGVTLLPQEFPVAQEGAGGFLPAQHAAPLVVLHGQISVRLQHICKVFTEERFGSGTNCHLLFQLITAAHGDPCTLGCEACHVILFLLQQGFGNQQGHIDVFNALLLEFPVHDMLNILPDGIAIGSVNKHALDAGVVDQLRLLAHIGEPLGEVDLHIRDLFDLFIFCHVYHPLAFSNFRTIYYSTIVKGLHRMEKVFSAMCAGGAYDRNQAVPGTGGGSVLYPHCISGRNSSGTGFG